MTKLVTKQNAFKLSQKKEIPKAGLPRRVPHAPPWPLAMMNYGLRRRWDSFYF